MILNLKSRLYLHESELKKGLNLGYSCLATNRAECRVTVSVSPGLFFTTYFAAMAPDPSIEPICARKNLRAALPLLSSYSALLSESGDTTPPEFTKGTTAMIHGILGLAITIIVTVVYRFIRRLLDDGAGPTHDRSYADEAASRHYSSPASSGAASGARWERRAR